MQIVYHIEAEYTFQNPEAFASQIPVVVGDILTARSGI